ncbi:glycosyl transferase family 1 [Variovorax sp. RO1]|uniref:glycosyltransferase n=1 Tax=Variovorax sp. RO1 TaxID=2066034 RepID=UPI000C7179E9|nr:glycosyltransferase [Variovorax sp. RO1]PLC05988.1 glycosyl transferase family 1 [Variovorax sp. RO1]
MRVLMVSDVFLPRINGVSISIDTFRRTLESQGVEVIVLAPRYGNENDEARVIRVEGRPLFGDPEDRLLSWKATYRAVLDAARNCDAIHIQTPFVAHFAGLRVARSLNLPVLSTYHTFFEEYLHHYVPLIPARLLRFAARTFSRSQCNAMDAVIVPSSSMQHRLTSYGVCTPLHVMPTGVPLKKFAAGQRDRFRQRYGIASDRPVALFVGRVAHEKNIGFLLDAWAQARARQPNLLLLIAGDGPALGALKEQAHTLSLGESVIFLGYLDSTEELPDCYAAADVFVFTSRTETQGLVLLEAMAAGLPAIALSEMGTTDILGAGLGCLTPPAEAAAFAQAILRFFSDAPLRARLRQEALALALDWSDDAWARRLANLYQALIAKQR